MRYSGITNIQEYLFVDRHLYMMVNVHPSSGERMLIIIRFSREKNIRKDSLLV